MSETKQPFQVPNAARFGESGSAPPMQMVALEDDLNLPELWGVFWAQRSVLLACVLLCMSVGAFYAFAATEWYRAQILLAPAAPDASQGLAGQLGNLSGLAGLAGIGVGDGNKSEPLAILRSRELSQSFISDEHLLPIFFSKKWDSAKSAWKTVKSDEQPDIRDGIKFFNEDVRTIQEDRKTGLVTVTIEWTNPVQAAKWANLLVRKANAKIRQRALNDAEANVAYLRKELLESNVVTLQQSIGRLLDRELQNLMLAKGKEEFAFRVIDAANVPKERSRPRRVQIIAGAALFGFALGVFLVLLRNTFRTHKQSRTVAS